jgi:hypothetical protein
VAEPGELPQLGKVGKVSRRARAVQQAMPVPPATNRTFRSAACFGNVNDPNGPSTTMRDPRLTSPSRLAGSSRVRNSRHPVRLVSAGADAIEYGTPRSSCSGRMTATCPGSYEKAAPPRSTRMMRADAVA